MPVAGAIAEAVRAVMPTTWDMLSKEGGFGDGTLRMVIDTKKEEVLGTRGTPQAEEALPLIVIRYIAKLCALELINPGLDAWRNKPIAINTTGTSEIESYSDAREMLVELRKQLLEDTRREWALVKPLITFRRISSGPRPASSTIDDEFLTPSPQEFPRPYRVTDRS
jgi:hypothetical protein